MPAKNPVRQRLLLRARWLLPVLLLLASAQAANPLRPARGAQPGPQSAESAVLPPAPAPQAPAPQAPDTLLPASHAGRISSLVVDSKALGGKKTVNIYLPPGYDMADTRLPVVYLLRGHQDEWLDDSGPSRKGRNAAKIADELIASGAIGPLILAMPPLSADDRSVVAVSVNLPDPARAGNAPGVGPGRFEDFLVQEVIPAVDSAFRTKADRAHRAVDGFSLGGFSALSLALRHPDLFSSVGAYEPSLLWPAGRLPEGQVDPDLLADMKVVFGSEPDADFVRSVNPIDLIGSMAAADLKRLTFHLHSAPPDNPGYARMSALLQGLEAKGVTNSFSPVWIPDASHGWYWADEHLKLSLIHHWQTTLGHGG